MHKFLPEPLVFFKNFKKTDVSSKVTTSKAINVFQQKIDNRQMNKQKVDTNYKKKNTIVKFTEMGTSTTKNGFESNLDHSKVTGSQKKNEFQHSIDSSAMCKSTIDPTKGGKKTMATNTMKETKVKNEFIVENFTEYFKNKK